MSRGKALASLWKDAFSVVERRKITKPNGSTGFQEVAVLEDLPCKLSFSSLASTGQNDENAAIAQTAKLFCDGALTIRAGSKIIVRRGGRSLEYSQSGEAGVFGAHQEIALVPFKRWA